MKQAKSAGPILDLAIEKFGRDKVITRQDAYKVFGAKCREEQSIIYDESEIIHCAYQNSDGADYRLVFLNGFSLLNLISIVSRKRKTNLKFNDISDYVVNHPEYIKPYYVGYYLINFKGFPQSVLSFFSNSPFDRRNYVEEQQTQDLGKNFRAPESAIVESIFLFKHTYGESIFNRVHHVGDRDRSGDRITVGLINSTIWVSTTNLNICYSDSNITCNVLKPQRFNKECLKIIK